MATGAAGGPGDDRDEVDEVARFVDDLKQLWIDSGSPTFAAMATRTGVSKSSLNDAVNRTDRPPSARTLTAFVGAIAPDDVQAWTRRRTELLERLGSSPTRPPTATVGSSPREPSALDASSSERPRLRWRWIAALAIGVSLVAAGFAGGRATAPEGEPAETALEDGADPIEAGCTPDAVTVARSSLEGVGTLQLVYSTTCNAHWARIERVDGRSVGNRLVSEVFVRQDPSRAERAVDPDVTAAYTYLLVREDPDQAVCARGSVWTGSREHDLPEAC